MLVMEEPRLFFEVLPVKIIGSTPAATAVPVVVRDPVAKTLSTTAQELVPARADRVGGVLSNVGAVVAFVRFGGVVTGGVGGYHVALQANTVFVLPAGFTGVMSVLGAGLGSGVVTLLEWCPCPELGTASS